MLGHSMGGLVARSACHYGELANHTWVAQLDRLVFLGSPHFGSPLEHAGTRADFLIEASPYTAPLRFVSARCASAGVRDLGHGYLRDEDWRRPRGTRHAGHAALPLPPSMHCHAMAASRQQRPGKAGARLRGDGLVPVDSALGRGPMPRATSACRTHNAGSGTGWDISICSSARTRMRDSQLARRRSPGRVARSRYRSTPWTGPVAFGTWTEGNSSKRLIVVV